MEEFMTVIGAIALIVLTIFVAPIVTFWLCYFGGWIAQVTIGVKLCSALNTLFGVTYFTPNMLPMMAGALGWIGGYFKAQKYNSKNIK